MDIKWKKVNPDDTYSSMRGKDEQGNKYWTSANQEVVICTTPAGKNGIGWTPEDALKNAIERSKSTWL